MNKHIKKVKNPGAWKTATRMAIARSHSPVAVYKNRLYIFGGGGPNFKSLNSSVVYDPASNRWEDIAPMPTLRSGTVTVTLGDKIYIMGGGFKKPDGNFQFLQKVEIYHPETDSWEEGPSLINPHDYPAVALLNGEIYVIAGHHPDACFGGPKTDPGFNFCEKLNPAKGAWEAVAPLNKPRFALSAVVHNGKILAMGGVAFTPEGFNNFTLIESYDPATNRWTEEKEIALPWTAAGQGTCLLDGRLYLFGGYSGDGIHAGAASMDLATGEWEQIPPIPAPRAAMGVVTLGKTIYLVGGWADDGRSPQHEIFAYETPKGGDS